MKLKPLIKKFYEDHLFRNSIMVMMNLGTNAFAGFFFWIIVARDISPSDVGLSTAALSVAALITTFSGLGMSNGLIRFLPRAENKKTLYSSILIINLVLSGLLTIVVLLLIRLLFPSLEFLNSGAYPVIFLLYVLLSSMLSVQNFTLIAMRRADLSFIQNALCALRVPIVFIIAFTGLAGIFYSLTFGYFLAIVFGIIVLYILQIPFTYKLDIDAIRKIFMFSLGNFTADLFVNAPLMIIPFIIINTIGATNNAYYYIAYSISSFLFIIPHGISMSLFVEGSHDLPLRDTTIRAVKLLMLIMVPALILTFLFGNYILLIFNAEYAQKSFDLLKLLAISSIFSSVISIYVSILRVRKNIKMVNIVYMLYAALIIVLGYISLTYYGLIGIGYAWIATCLFMCLFISFNVVEKYVKLVYLRFVQS